MITKKTKFKILLEALDYYKHNQSVMLCPDVQQYFNVKEVKQRMVLMANINEVIEEVKKESYE